SEPSANIVEIEIRPRRFVGETALLADESGIAGPVDDVGNPEAFVGLAEDTFAVDRPAAILIRIAGGRITPEEEIDVGEAIDARVGGLGRGDAIRGRSYAGRVRRANISGNLGIEGGG